MDTPRPTRRPCGREEKTALARRWQLSGKTQEQFCREAGISPRTLRGYLRMLPGPRWNRQVRDAVTRAIETLTTVLKALDQEEAGAVPSAAPVFSPAPKAAAPQAAPAPKAAAAQAGITGHHVGFVFPTGR